MEDEAGVGGVGVVEAGVEFDFASGVEVAGEGFEGVHEELAEDAFEDFGVGEELVVVGEVVAEEDLAVEVVFGVEAFEGVVEEFLDGDEVAGEVFDSGDGAELADDVDHAVHGLSLIHI